MHCRAAKMQHNGECDDGQNVGVYFCSYIVVEVTIVDSNGRFLEAAACHR